MNNYLSSVNAGIFYLLVTGVLGFITIMSFVFLVKSYRAGVRIGMDKKVLKKGTPEEVLASPEFYETFHLRMGKGGER